MYADEMPALAASVRNDSDELGGGRAVVCLSRGSGYWAALVFCALSHWFARRARHEELRIRAPQALSRLPHQSVPGTGGKEVLEMIHSVPIASPAEQ